MILSMILNGEDVKVHCDERKRLSDILHGDFGLASVKTGCDLGKCGCCTVFLNGKALPSCMVLAFAAQNAEVVTFEGFALTPEYADIAQAVLKTGYESCGFCTPGRMIAISALLDSNRAPDRAAIAEAMSGISCRCTDFSGLEAAIMAAGEIRQRRILHRG